MSERVILHSDMNCFYASVEMLHHPEFAGMPLAVGGDPEARHGIVLTANYIAKQKGVKTGMALWQAKQICPEIIFVPPRMDLYLRFSKMAREIYSEYTDKIEPYGIDEAWLDVSDSRNLKGSGMTIAREISHRIKYELGVTVSIGISWNKIYAKLGSDYKKPDAITEFNRENYKDRIWQLPASDLLYVGRQTNKKLQKLGIRTIGQLAESDEKLLESHFGKIGNRQCDDKEINTAELQKQSRQLTSEKMKLYDDYKDGRIDRDSYKQRAGKISVQLEEIKRKIEDAENSKKLLEQNELSDKIKLKDFLGIQKFDTEKLREIIKVIRVHSQDEIEIEWNFDDIFSE